MTYFRTPDDEEAVEDKGTNKTGNSVSTDDLASLETGRTVAVHLDVMAVGARTTSVPMMVMMMVMMMVVIVPILPLVAEANRLTSKTLGVFSSQEPPALELPPPGPSRVGCLVLSQELELDGM
uniref:Uncharacterized protein n=1 Tax=Anopheles merus TaxID=30066 RepID=A0A182VPD2_ANOME